MHHHRLMWCRRQWCMLFQLLKLMWLLSGSCSAVIPHEMVSSTVQQQAENYMHSEPDVDIPNTVYCTDRYGYSIPDGAMFIPGDDACRKCHCANGSAAMCTSVQCSPPLCVLWEAVPDECCQFHCIETSLGAPFNPRNAGRNVTVVPFPKEVDAASLGIRLAASAISSLLIVVLLLFMVQRLRQRRLLITMRRLYNETRSSENFVTYASGFDQSDSGFDFPSHEDPPPPYSAMNKPADDEPPSYEQVLTQELVSGNPNTTVGSSTNETGVHQETSVLLENGCQLPKMLTRVLPLGKFTYGVVDGATCPTRGVAARCWLVNTSGAHSGRPSSSCQESIEMQIMSASTSSDASSSSASSVQCDSDRSRLQQQSSAPRRPRRLRRNCSKCRSSVGVSMSGHDFDPTVRPRSLQLPVGTQYDYEHSEACVDSSGGEGVEASDTDRVSRHQAAQVADVRLDTRPESCCSHSPAHSSCYDKNGRRSAQLFEHYHSSSDKNSLVFRRLRQQQPQQQEEEEVVADRTVPETSLRQVVEVMAEPDGRIALSDTAPVGNEICCSNRISFEPDADDAAVTCKAAVNGSVPDAHCCAALLQQFENEVAYGPLKEGNSDISLHRTDCDTTNNVRSRRSAKKICSSANGQQFGKHTFGNGPSPNNVVGCLAPDQESSPKRPDKLPNSNERAAVGKTAVSCKNDKVNDCQHRNEKHIKADVADVSCLQKTGRNVGLDYTSSVSYEHMIDRIIEQIEVARTQFGWESSVSTSGSGTAGIHSNLVQKCAPTRFERQSTSCATGHVPQAVGGGRTRRCLSDVPHWSALDSEAAVLDVVNSNIESSNNLSNVISEWEQSLDEIFVE